MIKNNMTIRGYFDERIQEIRTEVVRMSNLSSEMIELAVQAATTGNELRAQDVIDRDDEIDELEHRIILETVQLVMREAPVASDLRTLTSTMGVIGEIEKVADDAVKLARRSARLGKDFPGEMRSALVELSVAARNALASASRLYVEYDAKLAQDLIDSDENIDRMYGEACSRITELIKSNASDIKKYLATMEIFHALEHIADRSVSIAKRMRVHYEGAPSVSRAV